MMLIQEWRSSGTSKPRPFICRVYERDVGYVGRIPLLSLLSSWLSSSVRAVTGRGLDEARVFVGGAGYSILGFARMEKGL